MCLRSAKRRPQDGALRLRCPHVMVHCGPSRGSVPNAAAKAPALAPAPAPREKFAVGAKVKAKFNAHKGCTSYYAGKIATDHGDGTYDVDYDDGDAEQKVPADLIVRWSSSS